MSRRTRFLSNIFPETIDPENRGTLMLLGGLGLVVLFAIVLIAYGYYTDRVKPLNETVLTVGGRTFDYSYLEDRVDAEVALGSFNTSDFQTSVSNLINKIQTEELTRIAAAGKGFTAGDEEVDAKMNDDLGLPEETGRAILGQQVQLHLQQTGLSLGQYREIIRTEVLEQKLRDDIATGVPAEGEQVNLLLIQTATQDDANKAKERLDAGEDFGAVASDLSTDRTGTSGGAFGWAPRGLLPSEIEDVVFNLTGRSDVIQNDLGFFIFDVTDKQTRPIDDNLKDRVVSAQLADLLTNTRDEVGAENKATVGQVRRLASHITIPARPTTPPAPQPTQAPGG